MKCRRKTLASQGEWSPGGDDLRMDYLGQAVVAHPSNPSTWEGEVSESKLKASLVYRVLEQSGLLRETLS